MPYTSTELTQLIGVIIVAATTIITAIVAAIAAVRAGRVVEKVSVVEHKVDIVEKQTNSQLTSLNNEIAKRDLELKAALQKIMDQDNERYRLAQTVRSEQLIKAGQVTDSNKAIDSPAGKPPETVVVQNAEKVEIVEKEPSLIVKP